MSRPSTTACLVSTYITNSACFKNLSSHDRQALMVYLKVKELAALGGTDYTAQLGCGGQLVQDATCIYQSLESVLSRELARLAIEQDNANSAGANISSDIQVLASAIGCLKDFNEQQLDAMDILVTCQLGRHAAYPQVNR